MVNIHCEEDTNIEYGYYCDIDTCNNQLDLPPIKHTNYKNTIHKISRINTEYYNTHYYESDKYIRDEKPLSWYNNEPEDSIEEFKNIMIKKYVGNVHTFMTALTITTSGLLLFMLLV